MTEETFHLIFNLVFILLILACMMFVGVCILESRIYKNFIISSIERKLPRCHRCDKVCTEKQIGKHNTFFVCTDVNCIEPSE
jgi:hypothetical protein